jgi:hypothetical protein
MRAVLPMKPAPAKPVTTVRLFTGISEVSTISTLDNTYACDEVRHGNNNMCGSCLKALDASMTDHASDIHRDVRRRFNSLEYATPILAS